MPRFVILFHQTPPGEDRPSHWDLMLETGPILRTWALAEEPHTGADLLADPLPDHRSAYLDYEGPVSRNRGQVSCWDRGDYTVEYESDQRLSVRLTGHRLQCRATLTLPPGGRGRWQLELSEL